MILVYATKDYEKNAKKYNLDKIKNKLKQDLKFISAENLNQIKSFRKVGSNFYRKRLDPHRIIASHHTINQKSVFVLHDIVPKDKIDYKNLSRDFKIPTDLEKWVTQQIKELDIEQQKKIKAQELGKEHMGWLNRPNWAQYEEKGYAIIYESHTWVKKFKVDKNIRDYWQNFHNMLQELEKPCNKKNSDWKEPGVAIEEKPGCFLMTRDNFSILYSRFELKKMERSILFLLAPFKGKVEKNEIDLILKTNHPFYCDSSPSQNNEGITCREITRHSQRVYPYYLIFDDEAWKEMQKNAEANLALSPEEEEILTRASSLSGNNSGLPLFLNGRAGSGKSTMLYYLFSEFLNRKFQNNLPGYPLFLTYHKKLLEAAMQTVKSIITCNAKFIENGPSKICETEIEKCFKSFQELLRERLEIEEQENFGKASYISFNKFVYLYNNAAPEKFRKHSPEKCWHVIRTFIKGRCIDGYFSPEDYKTLNRKEMSVSLEQYEEIYKNVWKSWYYPYRTKNKLWDDQDLARKSLQTPFKDCHYTAVFCDESQDFTKIELDAILQMSILSNKNFSLNNSQCLPFAFAGDPYQTLNPTGFRWENVKAMFHEKLTQTMQAGKDNLSLSYHQLSYNYRSSPPIVRLTNVIQLWRSAIFSLKELCPQNWWNDNTKAIPLKYIIKNNESTQSLEKNLKDTIIILPCDENEVASYVKNDKILNNIFPDISPDDIPKNLFTTMEAKGLEFPKVVLYKFGESFLENFWENFSFEDSRNFAAEYALNKLYVASSRAREQLFIVDSEKGNNNLWEKTSDLKHYQKWLNLVDNPQEWESSLEVIASGSPDKIAEFREDDPESLAIQLELAGRREENPRHFKKAAQFFMDCGNITRHYECKAYEDYYKGNYKSAGKYFVQIGKLSEAIQSFWEGRFWKKIIETCTKHPSLVDEKFHIANFMLSDQEDPKAVNNFSSNFFKKNQSNFANNDYNNEYVFIIKIFIKRISSMNIAGLKELNDTNFKILTQLALDGFNEAKNIAGTCYYKMENFSNAIKAWEKVKIFHKEYFKSKAITLGYPDGLPFLIKAGEYNQIIEKWESRGGDGSGYYISNFDLKGFKDAFENQSNLRKKTFINQLFDKVKSLEKEFYASENSEKEIQNSICQFLNEELNDIPLWRKYEDFQDYKEYHFTPLGPTLIKDNRKALTSVFPKIFTKAPKINEAESKLWLENTARAFLATEQYERAFTLYFAAKNYDEACNCFQEINFENFNSSSQMDCYKTEAVIRTLINNSKFYEAGALFNTAKDKFTNVDLWTIPIYRKFIFKIAQTKRINTETGASKNLKEILIEAINHPVVMQKVNLAEAEKACRNLNISETFEALVVENCQMTEKHTINFREFALNREFDEFRLFYNGKPEMLKEKIRELMKKYNLTTSDLRPETINLLFKNTDNRVENLPPGFELVNNEKDIITIIGTKIKITANLEVQKVQFLNSNTFEQALLSFDTMQVSGDVEIYSEEGENTLEFSVGKSKIIDVVCTQQDLQRKIHIHYKGHKPFTLNMQSKI